VKTWTYSFTQPTPGGGSTAAPAAAGVETAGAGTSATSAGDPATASPTGLAVMSSTGSGTPAVASGTSVAGTGIDPAGVLVINFLNRSGGSYQALPTPSGGGSTASSPLAAGLVFGDPHLLDTLHTGGTADAPPAEDGTAADADLALGLPDPVLSGALR
jgi:hypothetical protein